MFLRPLGLERLEDRRVLANLSVTSAYLTDGNFNQITQPVVGEQLLLRVDYATSSLDANASYRISFTIDGVTLSTTRTSGAGLPSATFSWVREGWYAESTGTHNATVVLDADNSVAESSESDNSASFSFTVGTASPSVQFSWPQEGVPGQDRTFTNYVDLDPTSGLREWSGGRSTYDGHQGLDFGASNNAQMDAGIPILAAAPGTVVAVDDGNFDRNYGTLANIVPDGPPNYVIIDHGNGWRSSYFHLRRDSVEVNVGDTVNRGDRIGLEGSSGHSTGSHLHFGVLHNGVDVDTFLDPDVYWQSPPAYIGAARYLVDSGVSNYNIGLFNHFSERPSDVGVFSQASSQSVYAWGTFSGLRAGDSLQATFKRPNNTTLGTNTLTIPQDYSASTWYFIRNLPTTPDAGTWTVEFRVNGVLLGTKSFVVTAAGAPEARLDESDGDIVLDGRYTPYDLGTVNVGTVSPTQTFTLVNHGSATLNIGSVTVPAGFQLTEGLPASLVAGASDTFTIALATSTAGYYAGQVRIASNDTSEAEYNFSVEGTVTAAANLILGISERHIVEGSQLVANVRRTGSLTSALTVNLASNDTTEVTTPASVTIPAGQDSAIFFLNTLYDGIADPTQIATITASAAGLASAQNTLDVEDRPAGFSVTQTSGSTTVSESGTTDTFTVILENQPVNNVVFTLNVSDTTEATVSPTTLTFNSSNWNVAQVVTVTGVNDQAVDGAQASTVTIAVDDANSEDSFDPLPNQTISVTTTDNDVAGFSISQTGGTTNVDESGATDTFNVVLTAQPLTNVTFTITSGDTSEATVNPTTLTFTPANWNTAQTVTVTGADDPAVDGMQTSTVTVAVDDAGSDNSFDPLANQTLAVSTSDNDVGGFSVNQTGGSTSVSESGSTDTIQVVLTSQPLTNVVITVVSGDTTEVTVNTASVTFTTANWNVVQSVTVTGANDSILDGSQTSSITLSVVDANSNDGFDSVADQTVSVITIDDDIGSFSITETGGTSSVSESGTTDTLNVVLTSQPLTDVVIQVSSSDMGEVTVAPTTLTFTSANWNVSQTVTATGIDDGQVDGNQFSLINFTIDDANSDDGFDSAGDQSIQATTTDNEVAGFSVAQSGGTTVVSETASTDTFDVVLSNPPLTNVVLTVVSGDASEASVSSASLTFTPANWNVPQTVTVTGVDDQVVDGSQLTAIAIAVDDAASDDLFDDVTNQSVSVTTTDDDAAGFSIIQSGGNTTVNESGTVDSFDVVLVNQPQSNVVFNIFSNDTTESTVTPETLTFTPANWNVPQTVNVAGANDVIVDGNQSSSIAVGIDSAESDDLFDALAGQSVTVVTVDDDVAGFSISQSGGTTSVSESGTTDTFDVVLAAQPLTNVVVTVVSGDSSEAVVIPASLIFTPANWNIPKSVSVAGVNDSVVDGSQSTVVTIAIDESGSDDSFDSVGDQFVTATTTDNEIAGFAITQSGGTTSVSETGSTDTFNLVLTAQPLTNVVLTIASSDPGEVTVNSATVTFTPTDWDISQTVTITGANDPTVDGSQSTVITVAIHDADSDDLFDAVNDQTITVVTTDDDEAGFAVSASGGTTLVSESGTDDTLEVQLTAQPLTNVVMTIVSGDLSEATVNVPTLTFTPANWNVPQVVTVSGANDSTLDGAQTSVVTISVDDANSDNSFDPLANQSVSVTTNDDDVAGFSVVQAGGTTTVSESGATDTIDVVLTAQPLSNVVLAVAASDPSEATASPATRTFTPANWNVPQTVTISGVNDVVVDGIQTSLLTISVDDANSNDGFDPVGDQSVSITTADDDVAAFVITQSDGVTAVGETGTTDTISVVLGAQPLTDVVLTITSSDTSETTIGPATLTFTPANWNTAQSVLVTGENDPTVDGAQLSTVTIAIDQVNSDDRFDAVAHQTVSVTTSDNDVAGYAVTHTGESTGVSESGTSDTVEVVLTAQPLTDVVLTITSDLSEVAVNLEQLTFTPANWNVKQTVMVTGVNDPAVDGSQSSLITVSVSAAISDDSFDALDAQTIPVTTADDDLPGFAILQTGGATSVNETGTTDTFNVVLTAQPLSNVVFTVASADSNEATAGPTTLTFTTTNWNVSQSVTVTGMDDLTVDGAKTSVITIAIDAANSNDRFDLLGSQSVSVTTTDDDAAGFLVSPSGGTTTVSETGTIDTVNVRLTAQPLTDVVVVVVSGDMTEFAATPSMLTFTPENWNISQVVSVTGVDDPTVDGIQSSVITFAIDDSSSNDSFDPVVDQTVAVTTSDDDLPGFAVSQTDGTTAVSETGSSDIVNVVLTAQPLTDVVISVISGDGGEATVSPAALTFSPSNWNVAQSVTIAGANDPTVDGAQSSNVIVAIDDAASHDSFDLLSDQSVTVTTADDDIAGFALIPSGGNTSVNEAGTSDMFEVVLTAQPLGDVAITIHSGDLGEVTVNPTELIFTPANWNMVQAVTVSGVDDSTLDATQSSVVTISVDDAKSHATFDQLTDQTITVTTTDDDVAGFTISQSEGTTSVSETGTTDTFEVVLITQPLSTVVLTIHSGNTAEATISPTAITFEPANWNVAQTVTVSGVKDLAIDGPQKTFITLDVDSAMSHDAFDLAASQQVEVTTVDDDTPLDYGDAPTQAESGFASSYPTKLADDGARHASGSLALGANKDVELDGQPNSGADGDDGNSADEDGIEAIATFVVEGGSVTGASVRVLATQAGMVDAWIDFNRDGDWNDAAEKIFASLPVAQGENVLSITFPAGTQSGNSYARFRISSAGGLATIGKANDGEVEDHPVLLLSGSSGADVRIDQPFSTISIQSVNNEIVVGGNQIVLFHAPFDAVGNLDLFGTDENDQLRLANLAGGFSGKFALHGGDGVDSLVLTGSDQIVDMTDPQKFHLQATEFVDLRGTGNNSLLLSAQAVVDLSTQSDEFNVLANVGDVVQLDGGWSLDGSEIEGGQFFRVLRNGVATLLLHGPANHQHPIERRDVNADGSVVPIDVLLVINELNARIMSDPDGRVIDPGSLAGFDHRYRDVNGDDFITALDALVVINFLNSAGGESESEPIATSWDSTIDPASLVAMPDVSSGASDSTRESTELPACAETANTQAQAWNRASYGREQFTANTLDQGTFNHSVRRVKTPSHRELLNSCLDEVFASWQ